MRGTRNVRIAELVQQIERAAESGKWESVRELTRSLEESAHGPGRLALPARQAH